MLFRSLFPIDNTIEDSFSSNFSATRDNTDIGRFQSLFARRTEGPVQNADTDAAKQVISFDGQSGICPYGRGHVRLHRENLGEIIALA